jgi:hypothetical protein
MKRIFALMAAIAVIVFFGDTTASAQGFQSGYEFGAGLNSSGFSFNSPYGYGHRNGHNSRYGNRYGGLNGGGIFTRRRLEEPPYFAKFPPVYYSHIVKRPYGVSPFAAPSGIMPVEMTIPSPMTMKNPYFGSQVAPVSNEATPAAPAVDETKNKATWVSNPYFNQAFAYSGQ